MLDVSRDRVDNYLEFLSTSHPQRRKERGLLWIRAQVVEFSRTFATEPGLSKLTSQDVV